VAGTSKRKTYKFDPDYVVPTADVLKEWLEFNGLSVMVAVARLPREERELAAGYLENVLADKAFTERTGEVLARVTDISIGFWMNFEHNYRTGLAAGKVKSTDAF
jgi:plasmid maintenance system antidote protein VapI